MAHDVWQNTSIQILRVLINDTDYDNYTYSDPRLLNIILVGAYNTAAEIEFDNDYTVNIGAKTITPDPSADKDFINLLTLKSACILLSGEIKKESCNAVSVKDGVSAIDYRGVVAALQALQNYTCGKYDELAFEYESGARSSDGQAILSPYSPGGNLISRNNTDLRSGGYFNY